MKRSLLMSICVVAIVAMSLGQAMAAITLSLNLRYTNPATPAAGGTWDLMAKTDSAFGIASIVAVVDNINLTGITLNSGIGALPLESKITGSVVEFVYGQDLSGGVAKVANVGRGAGTPGNVAQDDLFGPSGTTYDNFAKIASGAFGGTRPSFVVGATGLAGNEWTNAGLTTVTATDPAFVLPGSPADGVRGDSVALDGLKPGDVNRDGTVNFTDFGILSAPANYNKPGTWDTGDVNGDGNVNFTDFGILSAPANYNVTAPNPSLTAVPEPCSIALLMISALGLTCVRRR